MLARRMMRRLRSSTAPFAGDLYTTSNGYIYRAYVDADGDLMVEQQHLISPSMPDQNGGYVGATDIGLRRRETTRFWQAAPLPLREIPPAGATHEVYITPPSLHGLYRERREFYVLRNRIACVTASNAELSRIQSWGWDGADFPVLDVSTEGFPADTVWADLSYPAVAEGSHVVFPRLGYRRTGHSVTIRYGRDASGDRNHFLRVFYGGAPFDGSNPMIEQVLEPFATFSDEGSFQIRGDLLYDPAFELPSLNSGGLPLYHRQLEIDPRPNLWQRGGRMASRGRLLFLFRFRHHAVYWDGEDDYVTVDDEILNMPMVAIAGSYGVGIGTIEADGNPKVARLLSRNRYIFSPERRHKLDWDNGGILISELLDYLPGSFDYLRDQGFDPNGAAIDETVIYPLDGMRVHGDRVYLIKGGSNPVIYRTYLWDSEAPLEPVRAGYDVADFRREGYLAVRSGDSSVYQSKDDGLTWKMVSSSKPNSFASGLIPV